MQEQDAGCTAYVWGATAPQRPAACEGTWCACKLASPHAASAPCHADVCSIVMNCLPAAHHTQRQAGGKPVVPLHTAWFGGSHQAAPHAAAASFPAVRLYTNTGSLCTRTSERCAACGAPYPSVKQGLSRACRGVLAPCFCCFKPAQPAHCGKVSGRGVRACACLMYGARHHR